MVKYNFHTNKLPACLKHLPIIIKSKIKSFNNHGRAKYEYEFYVNYNGKEELMIFSGEDFSPSPLYELKDNLNLLSSHAIYELLGFLTLQPGDTDAEYFELYNASQFKFVDSDIADEIRLILSDKLN